jgi:hypothetical protein
MVLTIFTDESTLVLDRFSITSSDLGFVSTASPRMSDLVNLIGTGSNILDMIVEDRETGVDVSGAMSEGGSRSEVSNWEIAKERTALGATALGATARVNQRRF